MSVDFVNKINGSLGEMSLEFTLYSLRNEGAMFLNNLYIPKTDGTTTEIDLVMLYKGEIYVFESKNFSGWIFGNTRSKQWTQSLKGRKGNAHKTKFYNPIMQNENHIKHIKRIIGEGCKFNSIVVFSDRCEFKDVDTTGCATYVTKRCHVLELVRAIAKDKTDNFEMTKIYSQLYPYAHASADVKNRHIEDVNGYNQKENCSNNYATDSGMTKTQTIGSNNENALINVPLQYSPISNTKADKEVSIKRKITIGAIVIGTIVVVIVLSIFGCSAVKFF